MFSGFSVTYIKACAFNFYKWTVQTKGFFIATGMLRKSVTVSKLVSRFILLIINIPSLMNVIITMKHKHRHSRMSLSSSQSIPSVNYH